MDVFFHIAFLFMVGSLLGWVIELLFRRFFSTKKWINPGFLTGPYLPLYGCGVAVLYGICSIPIPIWAKILLIAALMTLIEYITGLIFIKGIGIKLWDYSKRWGNIQGIICPLFSLFWGVLGVVFLFFVYPYLQGALVWFASHVTFLFVMGMFYGVFAVDVAVSFGFSLKIKKVVKDLKATVEYEQLKVKIRIEQKRLEKRASFLFAFHSDRSLRDNIRELLHRDGKPKS